MGMPIQLSIFEALTSAGVSPDKARDVERQLESVIKEGQDAIRTEMRDQLMTKTDGALLSAKIETTESNLTGVIASKLNDQLRWFVTAQIALAGLIVAGVKLL